MIFSVRRYDGTRSEAVAPRGLSALAQVELCEFEVAGLGDLEVGRRAWDHGYVDAGAFEEAGFVGAGEAVGFGFVEGSYEVGVMGALRSLGLDDAFARDGGGDDGAVGCAVDLLDGVDGAYADDGCAMLRDGVDGALDGGGVDERTDGVVDEDDIAGLGLERAECSRDGVLAGFAAGDDADLVGEAVLGELLGDVLGLRGADCQRYRGDVCLVGKGSDAVDEDGDAAEREELLGTDAGYCHTCAETGCRKNCVNDHRL